MILFHCEKLGGVKTNISGSLPNFDHVQLRKPPNIDLLRLSENRSKSWEKTPKTMFKYKILLDSALSIPELQFYERKLLANRKDKCNWMNLS